MFSKFNAMMAKMFPPLTIPEAGTDWSFDSHDFINLEVKNVIRVVDVSTCGNVVAFKWIRYNRVDKCIQSASIHEIGLRDFHNQFSRIQS